MTDSPTLIKNFHEYIKDKYPDISLEEMKKICVAEFDMLREVMTEGNLEEVRLQYLFVVKPSVNKVVRSLEALYDNKEKGRVSKKDFERYDSMFRNYIKSNPKKFLKYKERIENVDRERNNS